MKLLNLIVAASVTLLGIGCKENASLGPSSSDIQSLAADTTVKNYALVFTGSDEGIPGVDLDPANINSIFGKDSTYGFNFELNQAEHASTADILKKSADIAAKMLTESPRGTLFWYLSSHGTDDGSLVSSNGCFYFDEVAKAIRAARKDVPLARLIVLIDTCFSGQSVTGSQAINKNSGTKQVSCDGTGGLS